MDTIFKKVQEAGGIGLSVQTHHSNFAVMMEEMANYLITDTEKQKSTLQFGATIMLIYRTKEVYEHIIKWGVLCSLQEKCIGKGTMYCKFGRPKNSIWAHCSRFDQSAVNILCSNYFGFTEEKYTTNETGFDVKRHSSGHQTPISC